MKLLLNAWARLERRFGRRATVALIVALTAPVLIAVTGLSVDVGYWYEHQESLQSGADAAAVAVADSVINDKVTSASAATNYAIEGANAATNNQFGLSGSTVNVNEGTATNGITPWTVTVQTPRPIFFSGVNGLGLGGMSAGTQSASAVVDLVLPSVGQCIITLTNSDGSGGEINTTSDAVGSAVGITVTSGYNCKYSANSAATPAIYGNGKLDAGSGGTVCAVGTISSSTPVTGTEETCPATPDPLSGMGAPPSPLPTSSGSGYTVYTSEQTCNTLQTKSYSGTIYFEGGFDAEGTCKATFGTGIYYFNGNFTIDTTAGTGYVKVNGGTVVMTGSAGFVFPTGAGATNVFTAPDLANGNCVKASAYQPAQSSNLYNSTNGEGICGIAIYQPSSNTTTLNVPSNVHMYVNGIMYMPGASVGEIESSGIVSVGVISPSSSSYGLEIIANNVYAYSSSGAVLQVAPLASMNGPEIGATAAATTPTAYLAQ